MKKRSANQTTDLFPTPQIGFITRTQSRHLLDPITPLYEDTETAKVVTAQRSLKGSQGVAFISTSDGERRVIKRVNDPLLLTFCIKISNAFGFNDPSTRIIRSDSDEGHFLISAIRETDANQKTQELTARLMCKEKKPLESKLERDERYSKSLEFMFAASRSEEWLVMMDVVNGVSLSDLTPAYKYYDQLCGEGRDIDHILHAIGKLLILDTLFHNTDRFPCLFFMEGNANPGNMMFDEKTNEVIPIDHTVRCIPHDDIGSTLSRVETMFTDLFLKKDNRMFEELARFLEPLRLTEEKFEKVREGLISGIEIISQWNDGILIDLLQESTQSLEGKTQPGPEFEPVLEYMSGVIRVFKKIADKVTMPQQPFSVQITRLLDLGTYDSVNNALQLIKAHPEYESCTATVQHYLDLLGSYTMGDDPAQLLNAKRDALQILRLSLS